MTRTVRRTTAPLPPVSLTPEEAAAVAVALSAAPDGPYADAGRGALEKVLAALEPDARRRADLLATSLWVSAEKSRSEQLHASVERAVAQRRVVILTYRDGQGRASRREVEPQLLSRSSSSWFLVGWCREREAPRWFREDRIESVEVTGRTAPRRDPALFGAPSDTHPAGKGRRRAPAEPDSTVQDGPQAGPHGAPPRLTVLPGGRL